MSGMYISSLMKPCELTPRQTQKWHFLTGKKRPLKGDFFPFRRTCTNNDKKSTIFQTQIFLLDSLRCYHGTCHARSQSPCRKAASDPFIIALFSIITHKQGKDPGSNPGPPDLQASVLPNALPPPWHVYIYIQSFAESRCLRNEMSKHFFI